MMATLKRAFSTVLGVFMLLQALLIPMGMKPAAVEMPDVKAGELGQWVNPFIGTGGLPWGCAMLFPGATAPFGLVRLSPDTTFPGGVNLLKCGNAGYYYGHKHIWGFSHTRLSGTGIRDQGHFRVTPAIGNTDPTARMDNPLVFSHKQETATAGYYAVALPGINALAELTATDHVGAHRYTFNTAEDAHLFIDATSALEGKSSEGKITVLPESGEIVGEARVHTGFTNRYDGLKGYFVAQVNAPIQSYSTWNGDENAAGRASTEGDNVGVDLNFGNVKSQPIELKIGISFVSVENARENLNAEAGQTDFEGVRDLTRANWEGRLSSIEMTSADAQVKTNFYTAMYHSMIMPTNFTDVNGEYLGFKNTIGKADGYTYRTDMSLWDTFRSTHPLYVLIAPDVQLDSVKSLVEMAKIGGSLPRWPSGAGYTGSMLGTPADMVIAESYLKGITDFDVEAAFGYMKNTALGGAPAGIDRRDMADIYVQYGYVPADIMLEESVASTLEYAWADASIGLLAEALGKTEDAARFTAMSKSYKNVFEPESKYFRARNSDGSWDKNFGLNVTSFYDEILPFTDLATAYCEGGARHWRWCVPQDPAGLIDLMGGKDYFVSELDQFMKDASKFRAAADPGPGYWHGNQHDMHAIYLFDDAGRPDLTQKWVRWALTERYSNDVNGLDGNDDGGTLSGWYVFSAIGFYPVAGTDRYWIGAPIVESAKVNMGGGKVLNVAAKNQSAQNIYVQSVTLNGQRLTNSILTHAQIANGGDLTFVMGSSPAANGGF